MHWHCSSTRQPWITRDMEAEAAPVYEQAFAAGLERDELRRGLVQYGSTLRNLGRHHEAIKALQRADEQFPDDETVIIFLALALASSGRSAEAVDRLINLVLDHVDSDDLRNYEVPLRHYADELVHG